MSRRSELRAIVGAANHAIVEYQVIELAIEVWERHGEGSPAVGRIDVTNRSVRIIGRPYEDPAPKPAAARGRRAELKQFPQRKPLYEKTKLTTHGKGHREEQTVRVHSGWPLLAAFVIASALVIKQPALVDLLTGMFKIVGG